MEISAGCSRWTNASKGHAVHIEQDGKKLCGKSYRHGNLWSEELTSENLNQVTCQKCLARYRKEEIV